MGKKLSKMTLEELWELFPIFLVQHDDKWKDYYKEIEAFIIDLLSDYPVERISHIGSTAIRDIWAKNKDIPKKALRIRFITFISDISEIMMNCISVTI